VGSQTNSQQTDSKTPPRSPAEPGLPAQRIAVALDTRDRDRFRSWCQWFGPRVGVLKVGLEAFVLWGPPAVEEARRHAGALFLDLKLHDIPNTVAGAVRSARALGVRYLTVHAAGGPAMLEAAVAAAGGEVEILAVTLLTHLDEPALAALDMAGSPRQRVLSWASLARRSGCAGVICSPLEAAALRAENPSPFLLVTPGIRPQGAEQGDQRRTATPRQALAAGADLLVVGRPLTQASDPEGALAALLH
jgi:orotidine-5'-phosphate decarboxylase